MNSKKVTRTALPAREDEEAVHIEIRSVDEPTSCAEDISELPKQAARQRTTSNSSTGSCDRFDHLSGSCPRSGEKKASMRSMRSLSLHRSRSPPKPFLHPKVKEAMEGRFKEVEEAPVMKRAV